MRLLFDPTFDAGPWPGPLAARDAVFGEAWVGPAYLLDLLETALGLRGMITPRGVRAGALVRAVRTIAGFWSESADVDPLGTARRLLEWRDHLWMAGWRAQAVAPRLAELARVTADVPPGPPDRLASVAAALARRGADIARLELLAPAEDIPALWGEVLAGLAARGTRVAARVLKPAPAVGDLARARARDFRPEGDGSLQLVRPHGPLQTAEEVAAWLATQDNLETTVLIGADPVLDQALHRHGLPTTGGGGRACDNALLQIVPLVLALGWSPPDPQPVLELLNMPTSPVPRTLAVGLTRALHEWPAVDSDTWRQALREGLAEIHGSEERERERRRLELLFDANVRRHSPYPAAEVRRRLDMLDVWMREQDGFKTSEPSVWQAAAAQSVALRELIDCSGLEALSAAQLERFIDEASGQDPLLGTYVAQAGLAAVRAPAAVAGPARRVVWWSFNLESVPVIPSIPLSGPERVALARAGVTLIDPGRAAVAAAERWRRPLLQATETLVLVCPCYGEDGTERHPHPLWDELEANLAHGSKLGALVRAAPVTAPRSRTRRLRSLPFPRRDWGVAPGLLRSRSSESPASLGALLGCSFKWAVEYQAGVRGGRTAALPDGEQLLGKVIHELLARILACEVGSPRDAAQEAERLFDADAPRMAAALFLPGADAVRARAWRSASGAARNLVQRLCDAKLSVKAVETLLERSALSGQLRGKPDLVVGSPPAVIDLKWGGSAHWREQLAEGTAHQLAAYSYLVGDPGSGFFPPVAFFILSEQRLLATDIRTFAGAEVVDGLDAAATWSALERGYLLWREKLAAGGLEAPGNPDAAGETHPEKSALQNGVLMLAPPCSFCDFQLLCGKAFAES